MYEELQTLDMDDQEKVQAIVKEKVLDWFNKKKMRRYKAKPFPDKKKDPYSYMLQDDRDSIYSMSQDEFILNTENTHKHRRIINSTIGRYPIGYRHFENYENYKVKYPERTIQDYHEQSKHLQHLNSYSESAM